MKCTLQISLPAAGSLRARLRQHNHDFTTGAAAVVIIPIRSMGACLADSLTTRMER